MIQINSQTKDQIFTFTSAILQRTAEGKSTYVAFLDLEKAYDKVWKDRLFDILWKKGPKGKIWRIMYKLNTNLTAKIKTKHGYTRAIDIIDSIRQGGPLSGLQFASMIDDAELELLKAELGISYDDIIIASLLLLDDITILTESIEELQKALDIIYNFASLNRFSFTYDKCKAMVFDQSHGCGLSALGQVKLRISPIQLPQVAQNFCLSLIFH